MMVRSISKEYNFSCIIFMFKLKVKLILRNVKVTCFFFFNLHLFYSFIFVFLKLYVDADCKKWKRKVPTKSLMVCLSSFFSEHINEYYWYLGYTFQPLVSPCSFWRWEFTHSLTKFDVSLQHPGFNAEPWGCSYDRMGKVSTVTKLTVSGGERPIEK